MPVDEDNKMMDEKICKIMRKLNFLLLNADHAIKPSHQKIPGNANPHYIAEYSSKPHKHLF